MISRQGPSLLMTNSLLSKPERAGGPTSRCDRALKMLAQMPAASPAAVFAVLKEVSVGAVVKGQDVGTL